MDEVEQLTGLIEKLGAGAAGISAVFLFAVFSFVRLTSRSVHANLEFGKRLQSFAVEQEQKRNATQTTLDTINKKLLTASVDLERYKSQVTDLRENINEYKSHCEKIQKQLTLQIEQAAKREDKMNDINVQLERRIERLISLDEKKSSQIADLINMHRQREQEWAEREKRLTTRITELERRLEDQIGINQALRDKNARYEKCIAVLSARLDALDMPTEPLQIDDDEEIEQDELTNSI